MYIYIYLERPNPGKFQGGAQYLGYSMVLRVNLGFFQKTSGFPSKPYFSHIEVSYEWSSLVSWASN